MKLWNIWTPFLSSTINKMASEKDDLAFITFWIIGVLWSRKWSSMEAWIPYMLIRPVLLTDCPMGSFWISYISNVAFTVFYGSKSKHGPQIELNLLLQSPWNCLHRKRPWLTFKIYIIRTSFLYALTAFLFIVIEIWKEHFDHRILSIEIFIL